MNKAKWIKMAKGAAIAAGGAMLSYGTTVFVPTLEAEGAVVLAMVFSSLINLAKVAMQKVDTDE